jgi:hypothetical protein
MKERIIDDNSPGLTSSPSESTLLQGGYIISLLGKPEKNSSQFASWVQLKLMKFIFIRTAGFT